MGTVGLLIGDYDPPTLDYNRAAETLSSMRDIGQTWLCPVSSGDDVQNATIANMLTILSADMSSSGKTMSACTVALNKGATSPKDVLTLCRCMFPYLKFKAALIGSQAFLQLPEEDFFVFRFASEDRASSTGTPIVLGKFARAGSTKASIAAGRDESHKFCPAVWSYIKSKGIYR
jgi:hypothetical protein